MAQPVWVLSVDLQTKTATFQSGMADAARSARGSFTEIKEGAREMGRETGTSMTEARHGVMLLGEEFGIHLPRALTSFLASLGPIGAAMEAAFPFLAIAVGATLLLEHLAKIHEEGLKLTESQVNFGTAAANALNTLNDKLLQAGIRADELNGNHLGALHKQLELIDRASMNELVQSFGVVAKAADVTFAQLKTSWYQWSAGSAGAKNALDQFKTEYDSLLAQGKDQEANDLLAGTRKSAERVLALQKQVKDNQTVTGTKGTHEGDYAKFEEAKNALKRQGIGYSEKEVESQEALVNALQAQANVQEKVAELKKAEADNARQGTQQKIDLDGDKAARAQAQSARVEMEEAQKIWEENYRTAVSALQENERQKIEATDRGSADRLSAIDASIKEENAKGLQETAFYKSLLADRVSTARQMDAEERKLRAEAGREAADHEEKMGELSLAAKRTQSQLALSAMRNSEQQRLAAEVNFADEEFHIKSAANAAELDALNKSDRDVENKKQALHDRELELEREHENQVTQIKTRAEEERNTRIMSAERRMNDEIARGLSNTLLRHQSFTAMMGSLADQVAGGMLQTALKSILADDMTKEHDAAAAARKAFLAGMHFPFPANIVMGPALGAMAFASVMAFEHGGIVPGVGKGDTVPAMLEPGEGVLTTRQMEGLRNRAKFGDSGSGGDTHVHMHITHHVQALDGEGFARVLDKHADTLSHHVHNQLRKMNR